MKASIFSSWGNSITFVWALSAQHKSIDVSLGQIIEQVYGRCYIICHFSA